MAVKIKIERLYDYNDCEQCGGGDEDGGRIWVDGKLIWEHIPTASCYDNKYFEDSFFFIKALEHLGIEVEYER